MNMVMNISGKVMDMIGLSLLVARIARSTSAHVVEAFHVLSGDCLTDLLKAFIRIVFGKRLIEQRLQILASLSQGVCSCDVLDSVITDWKLFARDLNKSYDG